MNDDSFEIDPRNLFGLVEVDFENRVVALHAMMPEDCKSAIEVVLRAVLVEAINSAIEETLDLMETVSDMTDAMSDAELHDMIREREGQDIAEEVIERALEFNREETQRLYDELMAKTMAKNGRLN